MFVSMARKSGKNDEARGRSRAALLQAGADLMLEEVTRNPFAALRLRRLCERAGLSTGAFYVHWPSLDDYRADLAEQLTNGDEMFFSADLASMAEMAGQGIPGTALGTVVRLADRDLSLLVSNPLWDATELVNVTWGRTTFRSELTRGYATIDHKTGQVYGSVLKQAGREPRPPLTWDSIGTILQGLAEGIGLRYKIDPAAIPDTSETAPGLYATAVAALLAVLTRPTGDHASITEMLDTLLPAPDATAGEGQRACGR
jgi:AcrR family transcriptional regulator